jgi:hypothetical protein
MTPLEILIAARALIEAPARWTKGSFARDADGGAYPGKGKEVCWCFAGAIFKAANNDADGIAAERFITNVTGISNIRRFNDHPTTTHADVLAVFDRAIERARADG